MPYMAPPWCLHGRTLNKLEVIYDEIEGLGAPQPAILPLQLSSASPRDYELHWSIPEKTIWTPWTVFCTMPGILGERDPNSATLPC